MNSFVEICFVQAVLLGFQGATYLLIQKYQGEAHNVLRPIDTQIPFDSRWIFLYVLWYPLIALFPVVLSQYSMAAYSQYLLCVVTDIVMSLILYYWYPTSFERPEIQGDSISDKLLKFIRICNYKGKNCMPSMHCSMCYIIIVFSLNCGLLPVAVKAGVITLSLLIVVSTVFTKQHVFMDTVTAVVPALLGYGVSCIFN